MATATASSEDVLSTVLTMTPPVGALSGEGGPAKSTDLAAAFLPLEVIEQYADPIAPHAVVGAVPC